MKIIKHTTYTYETSDGREFGDKREAEVWQEQLSMLESICMLDDKYKPTKDIERAIYVYAETKEQAEAFNSVQSYNGYCVKISGVGYYRYDEIEGDFVNIKDEIQNRQHVIDMLKDGGSDA